MPEEIVCLNSDCSDRFFFLFQVLLPGRKHLFEYHEYESL